jgi:hypothetical protein
MRNARTCLILAAALLGTGAVLGAASPEPPPLPTFADVTEASGVRFRHSFGDLEMSNIVEATGAGAVLFDYDGDGWIDIYFVNGAWEETVSDNRGRSLRGQLHNQLYRNLGDGTFEDVTDRAGVGDASPGFGGSTADYDGDGDVDLLVLNYGPDVLYRNEGDGTFTDVSEASGLADPGWSLSAPWFDADGDGDLDVYVVNYLQYDAGALQAYYAADGHPGPLSYRGQQDALYRNNGDGTFTNVTEEAGLANPEGRGMSATAADLNGDGLLDIYVANDAMANTCFEAVGDGTFRERAMERGLAFGEHGQGVSSMGPYPGDVNRDGRVDLFIPDMGYGSLLVNDGDLFVDEVTRWKVALALGQYTGWGGVLFDYDNDGYLDLFVCNGNAHHEYPEEDVLLRNDGGRSYVDVSASSGGWFQTKQVGRGAAAGDLDNDGDLDLVVVNLNSDARILRNDSSGNRSILLDLGPRGVGAHVRLRANGLLQVEDAVPVRGYLSQMDPRLHFGVGDGTRVGGLEIRWPGGGAADIRGLEAGRRYEVTAP